MQVGEFLWKRHIDQLRELAGSKVAAVELKTCDLLEIDLPETLDESVPVSTQDPTSQQSVPNETSPMPLVKVLQSGRVAPQENITAKVT